MKLIFKAADGTTGHKRAFNGDSQPSVEEMPQFAVWGRTFDDHHHADGVSAFSSPEPLTRRNWREGIAWPSEWRDGGLVYYGLTKVVLEKGVLDSMEALVDRTVKAAVYEEITDPEDIRIVEDHV